MTSSSALRRLRPFLQKTLLKHAKFKFKFPLICKYFDRAWRCHHFAQTKRLLVMVIELRFFAVLFAVQFFSPWSKGGKLMILRFQLALLPLCRWEANKYLWLKESITTDIYNFIIKIIVTTIVTNNMTCITNILNLPLRVKINVVNYRSC